MQSVPGLSPATLDPIADFTNVITLERASAQHVNEWTAKGVHMSSTDDRITLDPEICHGKPTIRGLRYPVEMILELLSSGMAETEILDDYPTSSGKTSWPCWTMQLEWSG